MIHAFNKRLAEDRHAAGHRETMFECIVLHVGGKERTGLKFKGLQNHEQFTDLA